MYKGLWSDVPTILKQPWIIRLYSKRFKIHCLQTRTDAKRVSNWPLKVIVSWEIGSPFRTFQSLLKLENRIENCFILSLITYKNLVFTLKWWPIKTAKLVKYPIALVYNEINDVEHSYSFWHLNISLKTLSLKVKSSKAT